MDAAREPGPSARRPDPARLMALVAAGRAGEAVEALTAAGVEPRAAAVEVARLSALFAAQALVARWVGRIAMLVLALGLLVVSLLGFLGAGDRATDLGATLGAGLGVALSLLAALRGHARPRRMLAQAAFAAACGFALVAGPPLLGVVDEDRGSLVGVLAFGLALVGAWLVHRDLLPEDRVEKPGPLP